MKKLKIIGLLLLLGIVLGSCNKDKEAETFDGLLKKDILTVSLSADYPPYESLVGKDYIGVDIEILNAFADSIGAKLEIKNVPFDTALIDLSSKKSDMVMSAVTPTPERDKKMDFSDSYVTIKQSVVINKKSQNKLKTTSAFSGKKIAVQAGTVQVALAKENFPGAEVLEIPTMGEVFLQLNSGNVDGVLCEEQIANAYFTNYSNLMIVKDIEIKSEEDGVFAAAFYEGSELTEKFNKFLKDAKESGKLEELINKGISDSGM